MGKINFCPFCGTDLRTERSKGEDLYDNKEEMRLEGIHLPSK